MQFLNIGPMEMILILVLALIVFGPGKLPEIGRAVGKSIGEFRRATSDLTREFGASIDEVKQPFEEVRGAITGTVTPAAAVATAAGLKCPTCSADNPASNKFCRECGGRLLADEPTATCSFCQAVNPASNKFCRECGSPMPVSEPVAEVPVESSVGNLAATGFAASEMTPGAPLTVDQLPPEPGPEADPTLPEPPAPPDPVNPEPPGPSEGVPVIEPGSPEAPPNQVAEKANVLD